MSELKPEEKFLGFTIFFQFCLIVCLLEQFSIKAFSVFSLLINKEEKIEGDRQWAARVTEQLMLQQVRKQSTLAKSLAKLTCLFYEYKCLQVPSPKSIRQIFRAVVAFNITRP